ncbi:MAG TPA: hypothetical protein VKT27_05610 [Candidatus Binataceae bacterium]|nr:hypothetical protein [Candidatus Binataceae bacterium]
MIVRDAAAIAILAMALAAAPGRGVDAGVPVTRNAPARILAQADTAPSAGDRPADAQGADPDAENGAVDSMSSMHMPSMPQSSMPMSSMPESMSSMHMHDDMPGMGAHSAMALHMAWSDTRPETAADRARAAQIVKTLQTVLVRYKDYRVAEADGFKPFHPELPQKIYHFTRWQNGLKAAFEFDPAAPTSLLYEKTADGGYELVGAMYTAPRGASQAKLDRRVPLSIARWHRHVNFCLPPKGRMATADWTKFGPNGSIATRAACDAAGGRFYPQVFGWMVHVYPWASSLEMVFAH